MGLRVVLEVAPKRAFASALDRPGWCRAGRTPEEALDALLTFSSRYAEVARRAKVAFRVAKPWSPRYAVRRAAWHVLDHAWEIEDRTP